MAIIRVGDKATSPLYKPDLNLDFANSKVLDPRLTFTRSSTATYYDEHTKVLAEQNHFKGSQDFANASGSYWSWASLTVTADATTAPDGTTTADRINFGNTSAAYVYPNTSAANNPMPSTLNVPYTYSIFAKKGTTLDYMWMEFYDQGNRWAYFDLVNGTISNIATGVSARMDYYGDGWYRCSITYTPTNNVGPNFGPATAPGNRNTTTGTLFAWGAQLEQRADGRSGYLPTTTYTKRNYNSQLLTASAGVPRFDHDPVSGESYGIAIEESRVNYQPNSSAFSSDYTGSSGANTIYLLENATVAPDGTRTAAELVEGLTTGQHTIYDASITSFLNASGRWTYSIYAKQGMGTARKLVSRIYGTGNNEANIEYDLQNGTTSNGGSTNVRVVDSGMYSVGNGWWRCWVTFDAPGDQDGWLLGLSDGSGTEVPSYTGTGSSIYIWGAQMELGEHASSYIPTSGGQVTRSPDYVYMDVDTWGEIYNPLQTTAYIEAKVGRVNDTVQDTLVYFGGTGAPSLHVYSSNLGGGLTGVFGLYAPSINNNTFFKGAVAYQHGDYFVLLNGTSQNASTNQTTIMHNPSELRIGSGSGSVNHINGHIKKFSYWGDRLSNDALYGLTED